MPPKVSLIDGDELDYKLIVVNANDANAMNIKGADDIPHVISGIREWFRWRFFALKVKRESAFSVDLVHEHRLGFFEAPPMNYFCLRSVVEGVEHFLCIDEAISIFV